MKLWSCLKIQLQIVLIFVNLVANLSSLILVNPNFHIQLHVLRFFDNLIWLVTEKEIDLLGMFMDLSFCLGLNGHLGEMGDLKGSNSPLHITTMVPSPIFLWRFKVVLFLFWALCCCKVKILFC
jgi:hypothetical protein